MPKSKKEGIMFSFIMSAVMIFLMAALNYAVREGTLGAAAWNHAVTAFIPGYIFGMICDLFICTPLSRRITAKAVGDQKEGVQIFVVRFSMVVAMTVFMTVFGVIAGGARGVDILIGSVKFFPYNFTIALPVQMLVVAPVCAKAAAKLCNAGKK